MPNEGRTTGFQTKSIQGLEQIGGRGKHMRKGWMQGRLENAAIRLGHCLKHQMQYLEEIALSSENSSKTGFHFQQKLEFSTIFKF